MTATLARDCSAPLTCDGKYIYRDDTPVLRIHPGGSSAGEIERIVHAVNSHDALVSALRDLIEIHDRDARTGPDAWPIDAWREAAMNNARAALAGAST